MENLEIVTPEKNSTKASNLIRPAILEFFKKLGNMSKEEFKKLAYHLLNQTLNRVEKWPKIVVHKFKENQP
jgi:hypothetical protein